MLLREDHREGGRTIKRTLANLSALPPEAVAALREVANCGWISCLRSGDIRKLLESRGQTDAPLFDQKNLAELAHPDFPGERLIACFNPLLAMDRERTRNELLDATEGWLVKLAGQAARRTQKPMSAAQIGQTVGRGINRTEESVPPSAHPVA